jgi:hypothetical protein
LTCRFPGMEYRRRIPHDAREFEFLFLQRAAYLGYQVRNKMQSKNTFMLVYNIAIFDQIRTLEPLSMGV